MHCPYDLMPLDCQTIVTDMCGTSNTRARAESMVTEAR